MSSTRSYKRPRKVREAKIIPAPEFAPKKHTASQLKGLQYEDRVKQELVSRFGARALLGTWFSYITSGKPKICQPDALILDPGRVIIVEVKLSHRPEAEDKLRNLYAKVIEKAFPGKAVSCAQVTRNLRSGDSPLAFSALGTFTGEYALFHWPR